MSKLFPRIPDFYGLIIDQCALLVAMTETFADLMETNNPDFAQKIRSMEHDGDVLKARNIDILNSSFATPIDREDIYRAIVSIDMVMNYAKTTVREMDILGVRPDEFTLEMAHLIREGAESIRQGYQKLRLDPALAEEDAQACRKAERNVEKCYRRALAAMLEPEEVLADMRGKPGELDAKMVYFITMTIKKRELYRHISNAADTLAHAGSVLHDIVVQVVKR